MSWIKDSSVHKRIPIDKINLLNIDYWRFGSSNMDKSFIHHKVVSEFLIFPIEGLKQLKF